MAIVFWTPRHRGRLYGAFDKVRLYNYAIIDAYFIRDMLKQKITQKVYRRIENEWKNYWEEIYGKEPSELNKILAFRINRHQIIIIKVSKAIYISLDTNKNYNALFESKIGTIVNFDKSS